jgi:hypothetical protein
LEWEGVLVVSELPLTKHYAISSLLLHQLVGLSRFELLTPRLSSVCSNQLSYRPGFLERKAYVKEPARTPILSKLDREEHFTTVVEVLPDRSFREKIL